MIKSLIIFAIALLLSTAMKAEVSAEAPESVVFGISLTGQDSEGQSSSGITNKEVSISVEDTNVVVRNASGLCLEVVSLTGRPVEKVDITSPAQNIGLSLPKGCYIIKVGTVVRKIAIR